MKRKATIRNYLTKLLNDEKTLESSEFRKGSIDALRWILKKEEGKV